MRKKIHLIAAARPNFMKIGPLFHSLSEEKWADPVIVHTGQHYDINMSDAFFNDLGLPMPHIHLGIGSGTHGEQTGKTIMIYEKIIMENRPDLVVVVGDVNSTMAATIAAVKLGIKVAHLEAGLRSFDRTMPEEINRIVTDSIADILWTPSPDADENLLKEGIPESRIERVGNIMIDSIELLREKIEKASVYEKYGLKPSGYGLVTLHRPANVDSPLKLKELCSVIMDVVKIMPLVFPVHPRTMKNLIIHDLLKNLAGLPGLYLLDPLGYIPFMNLVFNCKLVITDSGGIQEETTYLGIPCFTLRPNTERPITVIQGTNRLCTEKNLLSLVGNAQKNTNPVTKIPDLWDGRTSARVVTSIKKILRN